MKIGRTALTVLVAGCALSASAMADPAGVSTTAKGGITATARPAVRVSPAYQILPNGQRVPVAHNPNRPAPRGAVIGFNNQDCEGCAAASDAPGFGLNVAYVQPGSYDGTNTSTQASIFGLGNGPAGSQLRAPLNAAAVPPIPNPTHIVWNDYAGDSTVWPGGAEAEAAVVEYSIVTARQNTLAGAVDRTDTYNILFFTADGTEFKGGFGFNIPTLANQFFYQQVIIDLADFDPPLLIPIMGLMMVDCTGPAAGEPAVGVGLSFAGGDLVNTNFPTPESLVEVGTTFSGDWLFADGETGIGGPPAVVDPMFDMEKGTSYLDVLNTGFLVDWQFTSALPGGAIGTRTLAHDFPSRMAMTDGTIQQGACVILAGQTCFPSSEADCAANGGIYLGDGTVCGDNAGACCVEGVCSEVIPGVCTALGGEYQGDFTSCSSTMCPQPNACPCDFNDDLVLNSQDFFDFINCFFTAGCMDADFNGDLVTNSQDFFDFLGCFFAPPKDCN